MALTEASLETNFNTYIGDTSTDRISAAERLQFATEAVVWLQEETGNDHMVKTYALSYFDNVHYYKVTSAIASLLEAADLRRAEGEQYISPTNRSSRELAEDISNGSSELEYSVERRDGNTYLVVNIPSKYRALQVSSLESTTADGGTWVVDDSTSDATNLTVDSVEYKQGSGSLNFDVDVSQSGNNKSGIYNSTLTSMDLSDHVNLSSWIFWIYVPDVTYFSSITLYWGSDTSNYWSATATTDYNGSAWAAGWNRVKINWADATMTSSPDATAIDYIKFDFNYTGSQLDDTDFRIDDLTLVRPEALTFFYTSSYVGTDTTGATSRLAFSATTDVPYFSGQYDNYKYAVAHKMASLAFYGPLQVPALGQFHEVEAIKALRRAQKLIPKSVSKEVKTFKVAGIRFGSRRYGRVRI